MFFITDKDWIKILSILLIGGLLGYFIGRKYKYPIIGTIIGIVVFIFGFISYRKISRKSAASSQS